jgi:3-phosphoinositide dependent protein kinase-1
MTRSSKKRFRYYQPAVHGDPTKTPKASPPGLWKQYAAPSNNIRLSLTHAQREKQYVFEDPKNTTSDPDGSKYSSQEWLDSIDNAREYALSQSMTSSYAGDASLNELNSSMSSPASTIGGDSALEGVNIPTARHLRKDHGDVDSMKGRKRFSKRHSKNGLANF